MFENILTSALQHTDLEAMFWSGFSLLVGTLLSIAAARFTAWTGIQIKRSKVDFVHKAVVSGLKIAVNEGLQDPKDILLRAVAHAMGPGAGDTVKQVGFDADIVQTIAKSHVESVLAELARNDQLRPLDATLGQVTMAAQRAPDGMLLDVDPANVDPTVLR